jgi:Putative peptidoglycan-binding domain-containing protein
LADEKILEVQKWLNTTYTGIDGYTPVIENGLTGWDTVNALIEGLQHELGISPVVPNFGNTTLADYDQIITPNWGSSLSSNVIRLIQGAFWCKGMPQGVGPGAFDGVYSDELENAVADLKVQAGFPNASPVLEGLWAKVLFDMAQFVLMGDSRVREMQQYLNLNYYEYTGIMPTDGIYQRATNEAIIYGMQSVLGLSPAEATGSFGPTTSGLYSNQYASGLSSELIELIQFAIYANMKDFWESGGGSGIQFTGVLDSATTSAIKDFQTFMMITPVDDSSPDLRTVLSLVQSNGDWTRDFLGSDTSLQLSNQQISDLKAFGVSYVGRYLTGTVGDDFIPKNLTRSEANKLIAQGMHIIPIYQDNYPESSYYSFLQGLIDADKALVSAARLGIPDGTFIYFAVDFDALDSDIDVGVKGYFKALKEAFSSSDYDFQYQVGVYGTRNVCTRVSNEIGIGRSYVANMSSGWSGNLGFSQPLNWSFDQFYEYSYASVDAFDFVAVSYLDEGVTELVEPQIDENYWIDGTNFEFLKNLSIEIDGPSVVLQDWGVLKVEVSEYSTVQKTDADSLSLNVTSGELSTDAKDFIKKLFGLDIGPAITAKAGELSAGIVSGYFNISLVLDEEMRQGWKFTLNFPATETEDFKVITSLEFLVTFDITNVPGIGILKEAMSKIFSFVEDHPVGAAATIVGGVLLLVVLAEISPVLVVGASLETLGTLLAQALATFSTAQIKE